MAVGKIETDAKRRERGARERERQPSERESIFFPAPQSAVSGASLSVPRQSVGYALHAPFSFLFDADPLTERNGAADAENAFPTTNERHGREMGRKEDRRFAVAKENPSVFRPTREMGRKWQDCEFPSEAGNRARSGSRGGIA